MGGQTCDSNDIVCDFELEELEIGDWVVFYSSEAFSMSLASDFNGIQTRERPIYQMPTKNGKIIKLSKEI